MIEAEERLDSDPREQTLAPPSPRRGLSRLAAATRYSVAGLRAAFRGEEAVRMEVAAFVVMAPLAMWLGQTPVERVLLVASLVFVFVMELLNTAIESVVDRIGPDYHELSRSAKDIGSAAVLVSVALVFFVWGMLLLL